MSSFRDVDPGPFMRLDGRGGFKDGTEVHLSNVRVTRGLLHKVLRDKNIPHNPSASKEQLMNIAISAGIQINDTAFVPGISEPPDLRQPTEISPPNNVGLALDGYPKNMGKLRKLASERGVKVSPKAKREDIVKQLGSANG